MDQGTWGGNTAVSASQPDLDASGNTTKSQAGQVRPKTSVHSIVFPHPYPSTGGTVYVTLEYVWNYDANVNGSRPAGRCILEAVSGRSFSFANTGVGNASLDWVRWKSDWVPDIVS